VNEFDWNRMNPAAMWRDWFVRSEAQWSEYVSSLLKNEQAGGALNRQLGELQMMHRQFGEMAQAALAAANLPSRGDLEALDERLGRVEDGLAQVSAALARLSEALVAVDAVKPSAPTRRRRPPARAGATAGKG
jgi:hypothetical protein